jgi:dihydrofolate reductase
MTTDHTTTNPGGSAKGRRVVANVTLSLDGRTAGPAGDGDMGWLVPHALSDAARDHMMAVTTPATTVLLGRKNHEGFAGFWPPVADDPSADPRDRAFSSWLTETDKVVFSSTLTESAWTSTTVTANAADAVVRALRAEPGGDIVVLASSSIIRALLEADEVDQLSITLCPEILGGGPRLLDGTPPGSWTLAGSLVTDSGAICLRYDRVR